MPEGQATTFIGIETVKSLRCALNGPLSCHNCDSCTLKQRFSLAKEWFPRLSSLYQEKFVMSLMYVFDCDSVALEVLLKSLGKKDYIYAKTRQQPSVDGDLFSCITSHALNMSEVCQVMEEYRAWFLSASAWLQMNFLLLLYQICETQLLQIVQQYLQTFNVGSEKHGLSGVPVSDGSTIAEKGGCFLNSFPDHRPKSAPAPRVSSTCTPKKPRGTSAQVRLQVPDSLEGNDRKEICNVSGTLFEKRPFSGSHSVASSQGKANFVVSQTSSARCTPLPREFTSAGTLRSLSSCVSEYEECQEKGREAAYVEHQRDFIRMLPVHLSKRILSFLDEKSLHVCFNVSPHYRLLAKEVKSDRRRHQLRDENVIAIQGQLAFPHPCYARMVPVHHPKLTADGRLIENVEGRQVDVVNVTYEFEDVDMQSCYEGYDTDVVDTEERNVFCNGFNVFILNSQKDLRRSVHYNGGDRIIFATSDRKLKLFNIESGVCEETLAGHAGSVRCVYLHKDGRIAVSGGYETVVRFWDLESKKCKRLFTGHRGTVLCVTMSGDMIISSATDGTVKVWNVNTSKCKRTLKHDDVVTALHARDDALVTGCRNGDVCLWSVEGGEMRKRLRGHSSAVTSLKLEGEHIASGSSDGFARLWSARSDFGDCLRRYCHPSDVLCLDTYYCRLVTGCADGKIRIWNLLNGVCLRLIRGNSQSDPVSNIFAADSRLVICSVSNVLVYNFEPVVWDYTAPRVRSQSSESGYLVSTQKTPHAYRRAQRLVTHGSSFHERRMQKAANALDTSAIARDERGHLPPHGTNMKTQASVMEHVDRIRSGHEMGAGTSRLASGRRPPPTPPVRREVATAGSLLEAPCCGRIQSEICMIKSSDQCKSRPSKPRAITRCRSAPVHRDKSSSVKTFAPTQTFLDMPPNFMVPKPVCRQRRKSAVVSSRNAADHFVDLKLRPHYKQLEYEEALRNNMVVKRLEKL